MGAILDKIYNFIAAIQGEWGENVLFITVASAVAWIVWRLIHARLAVLVDKTKVYWDNLLLDALRTPISTLLWCWPAIVSIGIILHSQFATDNKWLNTAKSLLLLLIIIWILLRTINNFERHVLEKKKHDETTVQALSKIARLICSVFGIMTTMQLLGISLTGLLTFGGVGGLIVGLAAKDLLSNFFGGMMIYFDRPFKVGDWIRSPDRNVEGTVERIGMRMTIIRTFDKRPLYVPNSVFSNIVVENPSRMLNRRIYETIGLRYQDGDKLEAILNDIRAMLEQHPDIDAKQTLIVNFNAFGPSSLDFFIYTFTKTVNWIRYHHVKQDVMFKVMAIIAEHDAQIAFPTQTLHIEPQQMANQAAQPASNPPTRN